MIFCILRVLGNFFGNKDRGNGLVLYFPLKEVLKFLFLKIIFLF